MDLRDHSTMLNMLCADSVNAIACMRGMNWWREKIFSTIRCAMCELQCMSTIRITLPPDSTEAALCMANLYAMACFIRPLELQRSPATSKQI